MSQSGSLPTPKSSPIIVLLVDDQAMIGEAVRRMLVSEDDISYHYCSDPEKALDVAKNLAPTVILQDLVMPQIDGMTLVDKYRETDATKDIPLIVLSTKEDPKVKAEGFARGANDYLVKLPDKVELIARIRHHSQGYINLLERIAAHEALEKSQQALAQELREAADYVKSLLPAPLEGQIRSDWRFISSSSLGGDAFGYHWIDDSHLSIYLIDVCGHGVGAALLSISVINVLRSQALPEVDFKQPAKVLEGLNEAFPMEAHNNMYFTMWCGVYQRSSRRLTYSSGGHPPAITVTKKPGENAEVAQLRTRGMLVGAMPGVRYESAETIISQDTSLYVFSDGTYEIEKQSGGMLELEEFVNYLTHLAPGNSPELDQLLQQVRTLQGNHHFEDDFSIMKIDL